ncbi:MAG: MATE family efflux transporter [Spirochaetales bacterium]|nr:MATE family efflux transporter [Spirochaetales bacterium]
MLKKSPFYSALLSLAIPIMLQNLLGSSLSFIDTLMIGQLGSNSIAAVGIANQVFFLVNLFAFGIASGASVFLARYFGAKNYFQMQKITAFGIFITFIGGSLWAIASLFFPEQIMLIFTTDENVIQIGVTYQQIVALSYIFFAITQTLSIGFRSIGKASIPLAATAASLTINAIGNYVLIFGIGPFPVLGVAGAAIATLFSRFIELLIIVTYTIKKDVPFKIKTLKAFKWDSTFLYNYFITCFPVFCNEMLWALGMTFYKIAFSKLGVQAIASISVTESIANLFFVLSLGVGNAATMMIGQSLGEGKIEGSVIMGKRLMRVSLGIGLLMMVAMMASSPFIPKLFNIESEIYSMITYSLIVIALFQPIKSLNMTSIVGLFRGAADTRFALFSEAFSVWCVGVPLSFIAALYFKFPLWAVYLFQNMDEVCKLFLSFARLKTTKWIKLIPTEEVEK